MVKNRLRSLEINKAKEADDMRMIILKDLRKVMLKCLNLTFYTIIKDAEFPTAWTLSEVKPVAKEKDRSNISFNPPMSVLCNHSKVLEKVIFDEIDSFLRKKTSNA